MDDDRRMELAELLEDLQHDLGKHLRLPLGLLPRESDPEQVRDALAAGLLRTRRGPTGTRTARQLWQDFLDAAAARLAHQLGWEPLVRAVEQVLALEPLVAPEAPLPLRDELEAKLGAVGNAIRALRAELGP